MKYFFDSKEQKLIAINPESGEARMIDEAIVGDPEAPRGGVKTDKPKRKYARKKGKDADDLSDLDDPDEDAPKSRLMPETLNLIKERLNSGIPVAAIHDETGISGPTIYKIKKSLNL